MSDGLSAENTRAGYHQRECLELYKEHQEAGTLPTSLRFLFYELEGRGIVAKSYPGKTLRGDQEVSRAFMVLREEGLVDWHDIVDETRSLHNPHSRATVAEATADLVDRARINPWEGRDAPLVLCESRSLSGVISGMCERYGVPLAATNGKTGGFLRTDVGPVVERSVFEVLYFGDLDFSGGHIESNTRSVLQTYEPALLWTRLAVTDAQVHERGLSVMSKYDKRTKTHHDAVETEALSQGEIVRLLTEVLDERLPRPLSETLAEQQLGAHLCAPSWRPSPQTDAATTGYALWRARLRLRASRLFFGLSPSSGSSGACRAFTDSLRDMMIVSLRRFSPRKYSISLCI